MRPEILTFWQLLALYIVFFLALIHVAWKIADKIVDKLFPVKNKEHVNTHQ